MNKKRIIIATSVIAVLLAAVLVILFLGRKEQKDILSLDEGLDIPLTNDEATLNVYFPGSAHKDMREVLDAVQNSCRSKLNVKLNFSWIQGSTYFDRIREIISTNSPCDAFYYYDGSAYDNISLQKLAQEGLVLDITKLFPQYAPEYHSKFSADELAAMTVDGKLYGIPNRNPMAGGKSAIIRDDMLTKYGVTDIKNYGDFEAFLSAVKSGESSITPVAVDDTSLGLFAEANGYVILNYQLGLVYKWNDPGMKLMAWEQTPEFLSAMNTVKRWKENKYLFDNSFYTSMDMTVLGSGVFSSIITSQNSAQYYNEVLKAFTNKEWRYREFKLNQGNPVARRSPADGSLIISSNSKNAGRMLMFIEWLQSSQDNYDTLMYGIKGKHYELNGENFTLPKNVKIEDVFLSWNGRQAFTNIDNERMTLGTGNNEVRKAYIKDIEANTKYPPHLGFYPDYEPVKEIALSRQSSFYTLELRAPVLLSEDELRSYIEQNKRSGVDELVRVVQKQLDEWKAANPRSAGGR